MSEKGTEKQVEGCESYCPLCRGYQLAHEAKESAKRRLHLPDEFWQHRAAARREALLAIRSLVDAALTRGELPPSRRATRIKVE